MRQRYTYSPAIYVLTAIGLLAEAGIGLSLVFTPMSSWSFALLVLAFISLLCPIAFFPRSYSLDEQGVTVHCLAYAKTFPFSRYTPTALTKDSLRRGIRTLGSGGYFGFVGFFWLPKQGFVRLLVASERLPLLRLEDRETGRVYIINALLYTSAEPEAEP